LSRSTQTISRRDRNKQEKRDRIIAAAGRLFALHGVDEVTTQQIADEADIGSGTLFLYAKNKGELLLLVLNSTYAEALQRGVADAALEADAIGAIRAIITPIVECNRTQIENGRIYLREMVFGNPNEPHHREALRLVSGTEAAIVDVLGKHSTLSPDTASTFAHVVSAIMLLSMASTANIERSVDEILDEIIGQVRVLLRN
jgi:AcrR family transcriptional regulator